MLVAIALAEVAIDRVAVPLLRPEGAPPTWHTALAWLGLFLFYFTGTLATVAIGLRVAASIRTRAPIAVRAAHAMVTVAAIIAALPLVLADGAALSVARELAFALALIALAISAAGRGRDWGVVVGLGFIAVPLLLHVVAALGAFFVWPDETFDGPGIRIEAIGVMTLAITALATPYCFAPRPFARAVTRPVPVLFAMAIAAVGAVAARLYYPMIAKAAALAIGVELNQGQADPRLALYLLAIATLMWTLASCALADSAKRRSIGLGIVLIVLGGYGFKYPNHYLLPLLGFLAIADAGRGVREEELGMLPLQVVTKPIADAVWSGYITTVAQSLRRTLANVHSLTARGEDGMSSSVIVGEHDGRPVRIRVERADGAVVSLDVVAGREIDELRGSTLTLWAMPERQHGTNPAGPSAAPLVRAGDDAFDTRFRVRGAADALARLLDDELRARATATLDGWLAYWRDEGVRYRVYPGHGAPLDHPMPLSDLALGRTGTTERLVAVIELVVAIAARGVPPRPHADPAIEPGDLEPEAPSGETPAPTIADDAASNDPP